MLAARWHHRSSKDIDVKVNNGIGYALVSRAAEEPMVKAKLDQQMMAAGATGSIWLSPIQLIYTFGRPNDDDPPRIDLTEFAPKLHMAVVRTMSDGMAFWSSTNEEILAGKWKDRRFDPPVRDVFDFAIAGVADGPALQGALAMEATAEALDEVMRRLERDRGELRELAKTEILGVPEQLETVRADPAKWAARAIGMWAATEVRVEREDDGWHVSAACKANPEGCTQGKYGDLTSAVRRASMLGGLSSDDRLQLYEDASSQGGGSRSGGRSGMTQSCGPEMTVRGNGTVAIRDFDEATANAPTIEAGVEIAIERGWENEENRGAAMEQLRELQQQAIAQERELTRE